LAYRVAPESTIETIAYLRARELVTSVYLEKPVKAQLADGRKVSALAFVVDRAHRQFAGKLDRAKRLKLVLQGVGQSGPNSQYVINTHHHLEQFGILDRELECLTRALEASSSP
jgi:cation transport protein ChaC